MSVTQFRQFGFLSAASAACADQGSRRMRFSLILLAVLCAAGCSDSPGDEEIQRQIEAARIEGAREEVARQEAARLEALRLEAERLEAAQQHEQLARKYARHAGEQIMNQIGGGRDLIVQPGVWYFNPTTRELEIPMDVSFNGAIVRANNYRVSGVLTIREDGSSPEFARLDANQNYLDAESSLMAAGIITGLGALALTAMSDSPTGSYPTLALDNLCDDPIYVALRYQSTDFEWINRGWFTVEGGARRNLDIQTTNRRVYFYADGNSGSWTGDGVQESYRADVVDEPFGYSDGQVPSGSERRTVSFFASDIEADARIFVQRFRCNG